MKSRILLVEDETSVAMTVRDLLGAEGHDVERAADGLTGFDRASTGSFDLVILDVMLPGKSGLEVCEQLRRNGSGVAILMLTARSELSARVGGLRRGADDYLVKPFEPPELVARVDALLRRVGKGKLAPLTKFSFGNIEVDFQVGQASRNGEIVKLTTKEFELLRYLIERRGKVVPRDELLGGVWQYQTGVSSRTVDMHIAWLRQKLEDSSQNSRFIQTIRGAGYRFTP